MAELAVTASQTVQYLTFGLAEQEYGISILQVQEIKGPSAITPIPNTPAHVGGVMNLRGTIIPVINLRQKFGLPPVAVSPFTVIIVVSVGVRVMGLLVDAVSDVLSVDPGEVQPPPEVAGAGRASFVAGMIIAGEQLVTLLDIERLLDRDLAPGAHVSDGADI
ncbi:MAG: chemotaxis protein CheW [Deltaproteobacteria bacterium]|nr:chemotaxis protein CheW [Deltaproteobacteria bacterium]